MGWLRGRRSAQSTGPSPAEVHETVERVRVALVHLETVQAALTQPIANLEHDHPYDKRTQR